jgi:hypothetical protein
MLKRIILFLMLATAACAFAETDGLPSPRNKTYQGIEAVQPPDVNL